MLCATTHPATAQAVSSGSRFPLNPFHAGPAALPNAHHLCCESNVLRGEILLTQEGREQQRAREQQGPTITTLPLLRNQGGSRCCFSFCWPSVAVSTASAPRCGGSAPAQEPCFTGVLLLARHTLVQLLPSKKASCWFISVPHIAH